MQKDLEEKNICCLPLKKIGYVVFAKSSPQKKKAEKSLGRLQFSRDSDVIEKIETFIIKTPFT